MHEMRAVDNIEETLAAAENSFFDPGIYRSPRSKGILIEPTIFWFWIGMLALKGMWLCR